MLEPTNYETDDSRYMNWFVLSSLIILHIGKKIAYLSPKRRAETVFSLEKRLNVNEEIH